ncbi:MAG: PSD1 and planctomycete cytochrome C domain-containing protein [Pirellulaceae bacterium]|nr:PSD1 and planctomycete cytochrome C domain-containing protein [Pirellulaceae bacterium]
MNTAYLRRFAPIHRLALIAACLLLAATAFGQVKQEPLSKQDRPVELTRPAFTAAQIEFFESQVRPILVEHCFECHDPANGEPGGNLSLVSRTDILTGGDSGPAIEPGDPIHSLLIEAVRHGPRVQMPPDGKLSLDDIATLMKWIEEKSPWPAESDQRSHETEVFDLQARRQSHWSWHAPVRTADPIVERKAWPNSAIDRFILQRLEAAELQPAPDAKSFTWLRRVYLDILGLPPTAAQAQEFERAWNEAANSATATAVDPAGEPAAIRQLKQSTVDQLLSDPAFGEHWARHWLDLVRYAETCGHEFDFPLPGAFEYRDYVIRALNQDVPYDQWVMEHLAGDLLPQPRMNPESGINESVLGTMFWYLHEATHAPVDVRNDQAGRVDNQIDVFGKTFLGLTIACARCHDHKFDAISARDYYSLFGIVKAARRDVAVIDTNRAQENFVHQFEELQTKATRLRQREWEAMERWLTDPESDFKSVLQHSLAKSPPDSPPFPPATIDHPLHFIHSYANRPAEQPLSEWWSGLRERTLSQAAAAEKFRATATLLTDFSEETRDQWWAAGLAFDNGASRGGPYLPPNSGDASSSRWETIRPGTVDSSIPAKTLAGALRSPTFRLAADRIHIRARGENAKMRLVIDGYQMNIHQDLLFSQTILPINSADDTWFTMHGDIGKYVGHEVYLELIDEGEGFVAVSEIWQGGEHPELAPHPLLVKWCRATESLDNVSALVERATKLLQAGTDDSDASAATQSQVRHWAYQWCAAADSASDDLNLSFARSDWSALNEQASKLPVPPVAHRKVYVATPSEGLDHELYIRGNSKNRGEVVPRGTLEALRQSLTPANSLTPTSITKEEPSGRLAFARDIAAANNPLTARVMVNRIWLHLLGEGLVSTPDDFGFNGSSPTHPELLDYLALEFIEQGWSIKQIIREIVLSRTYGQAVMSDAMTVERDAGNLLYHSARVRRSSGEVLRDAMLQISGRLERKQFGPSVPAYVSDLMQGRGRPASGPLDGQGRRSVYIEIRRNFLSPWMLVFDTPAPFSTMGKRSRSNVPAQALALLNDPLVNELSAAWAKQILALPGDDQHRLQHMYWSALARPMTATEQTVMSEFLQKRATLSADGVSETWTQIAHAIFNLKEFAFVN